MLDESTRVAILRLREQGVGVRMIARTLDVSRGAVRAVCKQGRAQVAPLQRAEKAQPHREQILELYASCKGNLVRVHEELRAAGVELSYAALTAFCRRHAIGYQPPLPAGRYHFAPAEEMQHDTSPHKATLGGRLRAVQTASLVLCHSRMIFVQCYARFSRFECKGFLTDALQYFGGACGRCMIDNTHVVVLSGSGRQMVAAPEMAAFAERFGFQFVAHEIGDANRSARVERPFDFIDNNFLAGRSFADERDLNAQARAWCDKVNATHKRHLHAAPRELFAQERTLLRPLPVHVPEVYLLHARVVDNEGYVNVRRNRYSVPWQLIGRMLEVRESRERIEVYQGPRRVAEHVKLAQPLDTRITDPAHRPPRSQGGSTRRVLAAEEQRLRQRLPEVCSYLELLRKRGRGSIRDVRWLARMLDDYPPAPLLAALREAERFGMSDLERLERMVLRRIAGDFFPPHKDADDDDR